MKEKKAKKVYSADERRAYYIGVGASMRLGSSSGTYKKMKSSMTEKEWESFNNGLNDGMVSHAWKTGGKIKRK